MEHVLPDVAHNMKSGIREVERKKLNVKKRDIIIQM